MNTSNEFEINESLLLKVIEILEQKDFLLDEDRLLVKAHMKHHSYEIFDKLKELGFTDKLETHALYDNQWGEVFAYYNAVVFKDGIEFERLILRPYIEKRKQETKIIQ